MDADAYRHQIEAEMAAAPTPADDALDPALAVLRDASAPLETRIEAATTVIQLGSDDAGAVETLLGIVADADEPPVLRRVALDGLRVHSFASVELKARRADLTRAAKAAVDSDDEALRSEALELLAAEKDVDVQRRLIDGLRDESQAIVSPLRSIELLSYDVKADHYEVLREVAETSPEPEVRSEALRLLAADGSSADLLERVVRDVDEAAIVRESGSAALQSAAPERFEVVAQAVVSDPGEDDALRATLLSRLSRQAPSASMSDEFVAEVVRARDELDEEEPLNRAAEQFSRRRGTRP